MFCSDVMSHNNCFHWIGPVCGVGLLTEKPQEMLQAVTMFKSCINVGWSRKSIYVYIFFFFSLQMLFTKQLHRILYLKHICTFRVEHK